MPIYEYQCLQCGRRSSFLVRSISRHQPPACPKCGQPGMQRLLSRFAAVRGGKSAAPAPEAGAPPPGGAEPGAGPGGPPDLSDAELDSLEKDPRAMGRFMRKMAAQSGEAMPAGMDEVVRRLEAGEDPEKLEDGLGDAWGGDEGGAAGGGDDTLYDG